MFQFNLSYLILFWSWLATFQLNLSYLILFWPWVPFADQGQKGPQTTGWSTLIYQTVKIKVYLWYKTNPELQSCLFRWLTSQSMCLIATSGVTRISVTRCDKTCRVTRCHKTLSVTRCHKTLGVKQLLMSLRCIYPPPPQKMRDADPVFEKSPPR